LLFSFTGAGIRTTSINIPQSLVKEIPLAAIAASIAMKMHFRKQLLVRFALLKKKTAKLL
jgi:hypothetical protein